MTGALQEFLVSSRSSDQDKCTICGHENVAIYGDELWSNERLLGTKDRLCNFCFEAWYEGGCTNRESLIAYSLKERENYVKSDTSQRIILP